MVYLLAAIPAWGEEACISNNRAKALSNTCNKRLRRSRRGCKAGRLRLNKDSLPGKDGLDIESTEDRNDETTLMGVTCPVDVILWHTRCIFSSIRDFIVQHVSTSRAGTE